MFATHLDQIDLVEGLIVPRLLDVEDGDDVLVIKVAQQLHLSECSQTEHGVVERGDLLDGDLLARGLVNSRAAPISISVPSQQQPNPFQLTRRHHKHPRRQHPGYRTAH